MNIKRAWARDNGPDAVHVDQPLKVTRHGVEIVIDRPIGFVKTGFGEDGKAFEKTFTCNYGYIEGTRGGDNNPIDCYVGECEGAREVVVINQIRSDGADDEQKCMVGHRDMTEAVRVYHEHTPSQYFGSAFTLTVKEWKRQVRAAKKSGESSYRLSPPGAPAVKPSDDEEPTSERGADIGRPLITAVERTLPLFPEKPVPQPVTDMQRLLEEQPVVSPTEALFMRLAPAGSIRQAQREIDCVMSDESIDSYGTMLRCNWNLRRFVGPTANPVLLWAHNRRADLPPVGTVIKVMMDPATKQLRGTVKIDDTSAFDEEVWKKYQKGVMRGFSVGFDPKEAHIEEINGEEILVFGENELLELSCAPVPSNVNSLVGGARERALRMVRSAGGRLVIPEGFRTAIDETSKTRVFVPGEVTPKPEPEPTKNPGSQPRAPNPNENTTMTLKRIDKNNVRSLGDGGSCAATCPHCNAGIEVAHADLPANPEHGRTLDATKAEHARAIETLKADHGRALEVITAEKKAADARVASLETQIRSAGEETQRLLFELAERDLTALSGKKIDPAEVETERELAQVYIRTGMNLVPVDEKAPEGKREYAGVLRWKARVAKLEARADIGMVGSSHVTAHPDPTKATIDATRAASAGTAPAGAPPVQGVAGGGFTSISKDDRGRTVTTGGDAFARLLAGAADSVQVTLPSEPSVEFADAR